MSFSTAGPRRVCAPARVILLRVEILFTTLLALASVAVLWFACYVVYRLYTNQR